LSSFSTHIYLDLLAKIKSNIYYYQFNIWFIDNTLTLILNLFIIGIFGRIHIIGLLRSIIDCIMGTVSPSQPISTTP
jgi:hypothetical protein